MQASCPALHPRTPSLSLSLPTPSCLPCLLSQIRTPTLIPTIRRAALSLLRALAASPEQLLHRAPRLAPDILLDLIRTLSTLSDRRDDHLANDVRTVITELAVALDLAAGDPHEPSSKSYALFELVATHTIDIVMEAFPRHRAQHAYSARQSVLLLSALLRAARTHADLNHGKLLHSVAGAVQGKAMQFGQRLLHMLQAADDMFPDVDIVFCSVLTATDWREVDCQAIVMAVVDALPHRRLALAERMLLDVVCALWQRAEESGCDIQDAMTESATLLMTCEQFVDVMKRSLLSEDPETSVRTSKIIKAFCSLNTEIPEQFCSSGVFDYVVESIREITLDNDSLSAEQKRKLSNAIHAIAAISTHKPKCLHPKWCYSFDVILSACEHTCDEEQAHLITVIIGCAFENAPVLVFTDETIDKFISFEMTLFAKFCENVLREEASGNRIGPMEWKPVKDTIAEGLTHLTKLLNRYQPSTRALHSILRICEGFAQSRAHVPSVFDLITQLVGHFRLLNSSQDSIPSTETEATRHLGQRILFIIFDTWARTVEAIIEELSDPLPMFENCSDFCSFLDMLATALNPFFIEYGCCSSEDREEMSSWCWQYFPPNTVWHIFSELEGANAQELHNISRESWLATMRTYLWRISSAKDIPDSAIANSIGLNEDTYLLSIANVPSVPEDPAMMLLQRAIQLQNVSGICVPDLVASALCRRLRHFLAMEHELESLSILEAVRGVAHICVECKLDFMLMDMPADALVKAFESESLSFSNSEDMNIFRQTILRPRHNSADVLAWDRFSSFCQALDTQNPPCTDMVWSVLCESANAVESVCYALTNSMYPQNFADFLLDMFDDRGSNMNITKALDKAGAANMVSNLLQSLPNSLSTTFVTEDFENGNDLVENRTRVTCLLQVLSRAGFFSGACSPWALTRHISETIRNETTRKEKSTETFAMLSALLRCLIDSVATSKESRTIAYLHQSGLTTELIHLLRSSGEMSLFRDQTASLAASLLVLILKQNPTTHRAMTSTKTFAEFICDLSSWERLLCSFPMTAGGDRFCKVTNSCVLLDHVLQSKHIEKEIRSVLFSKRIIIPLTRAGSTSDALLETAATKVLITMMDTDPDYFSGPFTLTLFRVLCMRNLKKLHFTKRDELSWIELEFARMSVSCGYADGALDELEESLRKTYSVDNKDAASRVEPLGISSELSSLTREISNRKAYVKGNSEKDPVNYCPSSKLHATRREHESTDDAQSVLANGKVEILFGRYSVALTVSKCGKTGDVTIA